MVRMLSVAVLVVLLAGLAGPAWAQVYTPKVLRKGQVDATSLSTLVRGIYDRADAVRERDKAEAIWRYFLTDGRFVAPGFWYHIAGWAYEEPGGEVLDAVKLLNSYGFGLCYHIAPLLEAVFDAGGFRDARTWFLNGHTVAEVYYDGAYHYYDSDMMGYNCVDQTDPKHCAVASVEQLEHDGSIITGKLLSPTKADASRVPDPWYPADVRAKAIDGLADLFTTTKDNRLFPYQRYRRFHSMDFVLRRGERLVRYFAPEQKRLFYLPYAYDGHQWKEFPRESARWGIRTEEGPRSQKDARHWATGRLEYSPDLTGAGASQVIPMPSPYVIIDASVDLVASMAGNTDSVIVETSTDGGRTWLPAGVLGGPFSGSWTARPKVTAHSEHGERSAVSGRYGYLVRLSVSGRGTTLASAISDLTITTRFQLNPRTLPEIEPGRNEFTYRPGPPRRRWELPVDLARFAAFTSKTRNIRYVSEHGQGWLAPDADGSAELIFEVSLPDRGALAGFDAGARFLDLRDHEAPDKLTAEVRHTKLDPVAPNQLRAASLSWSLTPDGEYRTLWRYDANPTWLDGKPVKRLLRWPEVDREVRGLPPGTRKVYLRYRVEGMALDGIRLAAISTPRTPRGVLSLEHRWEENGHPRSHVEHIPDPAAEHSYTLDTDPRATISNRAVIFVCQ